MLQAARRRGVSRAAVWQAVQDGRLPATLVGNQYVLRPADVDAADFDMQRSERAKRASK
jgi:excisionase family DNA binding protein